MSHHIGYAMRASNESCTRYGAPAWSWTRGRKPTSTTLAGQEGLRGSCGGIRRCCVQSSHAAAGAQAANQPLGSLGCRGCMFSRPVAGGGSARAVISRSAPAADSASRVAPCAVLCVPGALVLPCEEHLDVGGEVGELAVNFVAPFDEGVGVPGGVFEFSVGDAAPLADSLQAVSERLRQRFRHVSSLTYGT